jgi:hypothetical protein
VFTPLERQNEEVEDPAGKVVRNRARRVAVHSPNRQTKDLPLLKSASARLPPESKDVIAVTIPTIQMSLKPSPDQQAGRPSICLPARLTRAKRFGPTPLEDKGFQSSN